MSLLVELFGEEIFTASLSEVKNKIKKLPPTRAERRGYLLKEYATLVGIELSEEDFEDVSLKP